MLLLLHVIVSGLRKIPNVMQKSGLLVFQNTLKHFREAEKAPVKKLISHCAPNI